MTRKHLLLDKMNESPQNIFWELLLIHFLFYWPTGELWSSVTLVHVVLQWVADQSIDYLSKLVVGQFEQF